MRLRYWILLAIILSIPYWFIWIFNIRMGVTGWTSLVTAEVLSITAVAILWYSYETREMRKVMVKQTEEMIKQTELRMTPLITVHLEEHTNEMYYENVGYGPAKNIKISDLEKKDQRGNKEERYEFDMISAIKPGGNGILWNYEIYDPKNQIVEFTKDRKQRSARLGRFCIEKSPKFTIIYENLKGKKHSSEVQCGPEGCKFL